MTTSAVNMKHKKIRQGMIKSRSAKVWDIVIVLIILLAVLACLLPMVNVLASSLSSSEHLIRNDVFLWPKGWNLDAYKAVLGNNKYIWSIGWTAILTVVCTLLSLTLTICTAFPLIYKNLRGGKAINFIILFTMYFSAGTIPSYILLNNMKLLNNPWALILPNCISVFNVIVLRSFFFSVPDSLREAAEIDGATEMIYFFKILLPVCTPIIATIAMWQFVGMWNSYFDAMIYLNSASKQPLQLVLRSILIRSQPEPGMVSDMQSTAERAQLAELLKYATIIISSIPLMLMYPFFQKYFESGVMAGAVKG